MRPPGIVEPPWREKGFETVIDKRWISGAFDRVIVTRDRDGRALKAVIIDFKSDEIPRDTTIGDYAEHYRPQMEHYRDALLTIIDLDPAKIVLKLSIPATGNSYTNFVSILRNIRGTGHLFTQGLPKVCYSVLILCNMRVLRKSQSTPCIPYSWRKFQDRGTPPDSCRILLVPCLRRDSLRSAFFNTLYI